MGPLAGLKILDFSTLLPGPWATMNLADLGAEVIRIASGSRPDALEAFPPYVEGTTFSVTAAQVLRNKEIITLDLKDPCAVEVIHKLVADYDIVIEQFRPGVMDRLGLGYEELREVNDRVIYCSLTGYGQTGPKAKAAGHDINYLSNAGIFGYSGTQERPVAIGIQIADLAAGANNAIIAVLTAVIARFASGQGQYIDISMTDGALAFNAMSGAGALLTGSSPQRGRDAYNGGTLYDFYETADGQFMALGAVEPNFFAAFADGIGHPEWASLGIAGGESLKVQVADLIRTRTRDEWVQAFAGIDACFDPVLSLTEALESPNSIAREMVADVPTASGTTMRQIGSPFKFSGTPVEFRFAGHPKDDSMHHDILSRLGYTREQVTEMEASGVFG